MTDLESLWKQYFQDVYLYVLSLCRDEDLARDVTGETFLKAVSSIDSFRNDCQPRVWLCQIAKNTLYTWTKKHPDHADIDSLSLADPSQNPEQLALSQSDQMELLAYVHSLKDPYKEIFLLRVYGSLGFKQIGELFGKSENWACVTFHRARKQLMQILEVNNYER